MHTRRIRLAAVALALLLTGLFWQTQGRHRLPPADEETTASLGSVDTLLAAYKRWKATATQYGVERNLVLSLGHAKGLSVTFTKAYG